MATVSKEPEFIRLLDASGSRVLDSVSTEYEDSFCLDSFGELATDAQDTEPQGKGLVGNIHDSPIES
jgi:hypothetical protein